jgi:hypothetical protein
MRGKAELLGNAPVVVHELQSGFNRFVASGFGWKAGDSLDDPP